MSFVRGAGDALKKVERRLKVQVDRGPWEVGANLFHGAKPALVREGRIGRQVKFRAAEASSCPVQIYLSLVGQKFENEIRHGIRA